MRMIRQWAKDEYSTVVCPGRYPLAFDLCCGLGGWTRGLKTAGWEVWGFDVDLDFRECYPGDRFYDLDVRTLPDTSLGCSKPDLIVASPPCQEFSRHDMPWTRTRNPPPPDKSIWEACITLARVLETPIVIENVRGAQLFMGKAKARYGSRYLWGDIPEFL